jgi:hypothetical protein
MGDTIANTARGGANILANRKVIDMSSDLPLLKPRVAPLHAITAKLKTKACNSYKFEWMEDSLMARWVAANGARLQETQRLFCTLVKVASLQ